ncbi:hypothetical protein [Lacibacter sp. H407]|uniref:hypothetical protein n=1 Tax=Lacibacter sp. H407 TaxID=3133423 RepID=UPI0030BF6EDE
MEFDFYEQYKDYSNYDLLKIVKQPDAYQPAALAAASQILSERQVTAEEVQLANDYFHNIEKLAKAKKEKVDQIKTKAVDLFEPVLYPSEKVEPAKWVNIFLLVIAIQYAWSLFKLIKRLVNFFQCSHCRFDIFFFVELLTLLYVPIIFFLLLKRRPWGWILLFADNLFSLILSVSQSHSFFKYQSIHEGDTFYFLVPILIKTAFLFFLWSAPISTHFNINQEAKKKTALTAATITLLFIAVMYLLM